MCPFFLPSPRENRGGAERRRRRPIRAPCASAAARGRGKRSREVGRLDSPTWLALGWSEEAGLRGRAAAATGVRRGDAAAGERRAAGVSEVGVGVWSSEAPPFVLYIGG